MINPKIIQEDCCNSESNQLALDFGLTAQKPGDSGNGTNGKDGKDGLSAYQIAQVAGFTGTYIQWLASLIGPPGMSAYVIAVQNGFVGTVAEWLLSLVGKDGKSAYDLAVEGGFDGTVEEWLFYLANNYVLPIASDTVLGGIKIGEGLVIDANGKVSVDIDISLQASTDAGNRTTNDIILDESKVTFETPTDVARRIVTDSNNSGITFDRNKDLYIIDFDSGAVKKALRSENYATFTTVLSRAGTGTALNMWTNSTGILVDKDDNIYINDYTNYRVLKFAPGQTSGVIVAGGNGIGSGLNQLSDARTSAIGPDGNLYVVDANNHRVLKYTAGNPVGVVVAGGNGSGAGLNQFAAPNGITFDKNGLAYIADTFNYRILRFNFAVSPLGTVVAGGNGTGAGLNQLSAARSVAVDDNLNIYIADFLNKRILKYAPGAITGTVVSNWNTGIAPFNALTYPYHLVVDPSGLNVYATDSYNKAIIIDYIGDEKVDLEARNGELYRNDAKLLTEYDMPDTSNFAIKPQIKDIIDVRLPGKVDKDASHLANRVIFVDPDTGKLIGQANFTFDKTTGQIKVNTTAVNGNYKALIGGGLSLTSGAFNMDEYQSILYMSGGRCALIVDGNGMHYRLFNNDLTDHPDTSKSFVWRNKGFVHFRCYTDVLALNGLGQPTAWRQINEFQKFIKMPDLPVNSGAYNVVVQHSATKELQLVNKDLLSARRNVLDLPLIDDGDLSGIGDYEEYRTSLGEIKYKLPASASTFSVEFTNTFY